MIAAVPYADADEVLDSALLLGFIVAPVDRREYTRAIGEILDKLESLPVTEWSLAEMVWRISSLGGGEDVRLPRHLPAQVVEHRGVEMGGCLAIRGEGHGRASMGMAWLLVAVVAWGAKGVVIIGGCPPATAP